MYFGVVVTEGQWKMTSKPGCQSITQSQTFCQAPLAQHSDREPCEFRLTMPTMIPEKEARNKRLRRSILRLGSDFAGLDTAAWALRVLGIPFEHTFAADTDRSSRKVLSYMGAKTIYMDVTTRPATKAPSVDLYTFGPPCQPFSAAGNRLSTATSDGVLALHSLSYIKHHQPSMILMEQVPDVVSIASDLVNLLFQELTALGYSLSSEILASNKYGVPQKCERLFVVGIKNPVEPLVFPAEVPLWPVRTQIAPLPPGKFVVLPSVGTGISAQKVANVTSHMEGAVAEGVDPFERAVFVSAGASKRWSHRSVDEVMTLTKTEATRQGYWCSLKGGFLDTDDIGVLQGFPRGMIPWRDLDISSPQQAGLYGNAMNLAVMLHLIPHVLHSAGFLSKAEMNKKLKYARDYDPGIPYLPGAE